MQLRKKSEQTEKQDDACQYEEKQKVQKEQLMNEGYTDIQEIFKDNIK